MVGVLFHQLTAKHIREPAHVTVQRKHMTDCLRGHFEQAARDPVPVSDAKRVPTARERQLTEEAIAGFFRSWQSDVIGVSSAATPSASPETVPDAFHRQAVQQALPSRWALLDFWQVNEHELKVFVLTWDQFRVETLANPDQHEEFLNLANDWLRATYTGPEPGFDDSVLDWLDAFLFAPLRQRGLLDGVRGLYLVPHGQLHRLPLHAARRQDERAQVRHLCDDFLISYLPSAALLPQLPPPDWRGRVHSLANPEEGTRHTLPFSQWEGGQLQSRYPDQWLHIGKTGTWQRAAEWGDAAAG